MWRLTRTQWLVLGCGVAAVALALVAAAPTPTTHATDPSCPVGKFGNLSTAGCSVPAGPSFSVPCSVNWEGLVWCTINTPDLNPVDWAGFIGCELTSGLTVVGSAIWNAVAGVVGYIATTVVNAAASAIGTVVSAVEGAITGLISGIGQLLINAENAIDSAALDAGPLAPVVITALWLSIGVVAAAALYLAFLGLIALAKTVFNLM